MKRINFLKSLLGIAVAPMAIAKAIEKCDVKTPSGYIETTEDLDNVISSFKSRRVGHTHIGLRNHSSIMRNPILISETTHLITGDEEYIKTETKDGYTFIYKRWPELFPNEKIG